MCAGVWCVGVYIIFVHLVLFCAGELVTKQPLIASMRTVKKETLKLISCWVSKSQDPGMVREHFLPPLLDAILGDYRRNVPGAREPEVLSTVTAIVERLEVSNLQSDLPRLHLFCSPVPQMMSLLFWTHCSNVPWR